jgi:hypothetical protein
VWVKFRTEPDLFGTGAYNYNLVEWNVITTVGKIWQQYSKQSLRDLIQKETGILIPEPEKPPRKAKATRERSRSPRQSSSSSSA